MLRSEEHLLNEIAKAFWMSGFSLERAVVPNKLKAFINTSPSAKRVVYESDFFLTRVQFSKKKNRMILEWK